MANMQGRVIKILMAVILLTSMYFVAREGAAYVNSVRVETEKQPCVIIDAGHGGRDPGKLGINGSQEKDINLAIAQKLKKFLEAQDIRVVMTRETDAGLYDESASNKKVQDMKRRLAIIDQEEPILVVSIHQNSYPAENVHGAQVFYYTTSTVGKELADILQKRLAKDLDPENRRAAKGNDSYYLLKKTAFPIAIIECGFLTNSKEAEKLSTDIYQEKVAWSVHMGIIQYINSQK